MPDITELDKLRLTADFGVLPRVWGDAVTTGIMRRRPEDFQVAELLPFEPSGEGEHLFLRIRKTGHNTRWVAKRLADAAGIDYRATGYAGLKDRRAVAEQWFSLHLPGRDDPVLPEIPGVEVLQQIRHDNKLRTGALAGNRFRLVLHDCTGDPDTIVERLERIRAQGAPNYFGAQRFGRDARNLELLNGDGRIGREARSFGLSALRSALFNGYIAMRITAGNWAELLDGEVPARGQEHDAPTGLLWGTGENRSSGRALEMELAWFSGFSQTCAMLESAGVRMMRRALAVVPEDFSWQLDEDRIELEFGLPRGAYASSIVRELGDFAEPAPGESPAQE